MSTHVRLGSWQPGVATVAAISAICVVAAGCGSSSSSSSTKPALTKAQFLAQGNAICTAGNLKNRAAQKAFAKTIGKRGPTPAQIIPYVKNTFAPEIQSQIDALRALGAPSADKATITHMLDVAQADLNQVKNNPAALAGKTSAFVSFARLAHPYGLTACDPRDK